MSLNQPRSTISQDERVLQNKFGLAITSLSTLSVLLYTAMCFDLIEPVLFYDTVMMRQLNEGRFPVVLALISMVPALATGVGMRVSMAMHASILNLILLALVTWKVYEKIQMAGKMNGGGDVQYLAVSLAQDLVVMGAFWGISWHACASSSLAGENYISLLRAGRQADSILNHILKNSIAGRSCIHFTLSLTPSYIAHLPVICVRFVNFMLMYCLQGLPVSSSSIRKTMVL